MPDTISTEKNKYLINGDIVRLTSGRISFSDILPPAHYTLGMEETGMFITRAAPFVLPPKLFGDIEDTAARILYTWSETGFDTMGVMLSGLKGGGKTLMAKYISNLLVDGLAGGLLDRRAPAPVPAPPHIADRIPSIMINQHFPAAALADFLGRIEDKALVIFDEFETAYNYKNSDHNDQEKLLSLFDGVMQPKNKLFILTYNDTCRVDDRLYNRPRRMLYHLSYDILPAAEVRDYCNEYLKDKAFTKILSLFPSIIRDFSYDILDKLVKEMNRYGESPFQALKYLNVHIGGNAEFTGRLINRADNNRKFSAYARKSLEKSEDRVFRASVFDKISIYYNKNGDGRGSKKDPAEIEFLPENIQGIGDNEIVFVKEPWELRMTPYVREDTSAVSIGAKIAASRMSEITF